MFVNVERRQRIHPRWATPLLVLLCVAMFAALTLMPADRALALVLRWGVVPARLLVTGSWLPRVDANLLHLFGALFIHVAWLHLLTNLLFLVIFGLPAERRLGSPRFLALFVLCGAAANLVGAISLAGVHAPIIGCSGAVSAIVGAYLTLFPRARLGLVLPLGLYLEFVRVPAYLLIGIWALLQLLFTYAGAGYGAVVWWCHIAGFLFGVIFALLSRGAIVRRQRR